MSFNVVIKRCISHYFSNGTDTRVPQNVFLVESGFGSADLDDMQLLGEENPFLNIEHI